METFDTTKTALPDLLRDITRGRIQLPDFQRGWVWDDDHVRSLLVSVARSFPIGALMLMETGGDVMFQVRPVEGTDSALNDVEPEKLILDGQQRLTSLTQAVGLTSPVHTRTAKGKPIQRHYYFHIPTALAGEDLLDEAIDAVDKNREKRSNFGRTVDLDLSTRQKECEQLYFPCDQVLSWSHWLQELNQFNPSALPVFLEFQGRILQAFNDYQLPVIELKKETSKEAVCLVFEKVNTGGVQLSVFELITASYAAEGFNLRDDWLGSEQRGMESRKGRLAEDVLLEHLDSTEFIQAITLLHTRERKYQDIADGRQGKQIRPISAKRASMLELPLTAYTQWADTVEQGFWQAAAFLRKECFFLNREIPYSTQLIPLAAMMTVLGNRWREPRINAKLSRWFWCGVLGELYGGAVETRIANDLEDLLAWVEDDEAAPRTVVDASFNPDRLDLLKTRLSAAYKGLNVLVLREQARDFFWNDTVQSLNHQGIDLDIHHIFPKDWCKRNGIPPRHYDSIVNKTPISYKANRKIGGDAPSVYLRKIQTDKQVQTTDAAMDAILASHRAPAEPMRTDDFDAFYEQRKANLLGLIEKAMGKRIAREQAE